MRFHGVTDIPLINMQGFEFTAQLSVRPRRAASARWPARRSRSTSRRSTMPTPDSGQRGHARTRTIRPARRRPSPAATGVPGRRRRAEFVHPYSNIFGLTGELVRGQLHQHRLPPGDRLPDRRAVPDRSPEPRECAVRGRLQQRRRLVPGNRRSRRSASPSATSGPAWSASTGRPGSSGSTRAPPGSSPASSSGATSTGRQSDLRGSVLTAGREAVLHAARPGQPTVWPAELDRRTASGSGTTAPSPALRAHADAGRDDLRPERHRRQRYAVGDAHDPGGDQLLLRRHDRAVHRHGHRPGQPQLLCPAEGRLLPHQQPDHPVPRRTSTPTSAPAEPASIPGAPAV